MTLAQKPEEHDDEENCIRPNGHDGHQEEMGPGRIYYTAPVIFWARIPYCADLQCRGCNRRCTVSLSMRFLVEKIG
jgi:hypothetical protein